MDRPLLHHPTFTRDELGIIGAAIGTLMAIGGLPDDADRDAKSILSKIESAFGMPRGDLDNKINEIRLI